MIKSTFFSRFQSWLSEWDETKTRQVLVVLLAVLVGLLVGLVIDTFTRVVGDFFFSQPLPLDMASKDKLPELYSRFGLEAFGIKILSWAVGTLSGGYCSVRMAKMGQFPAWIVGILLFAGYLIGLLAVPSPIWVRILCPLLVAACAYGAGWLGMYVTVQKAQSVQA